ncbi:MAG: GDSL-type esterase/lipase family protein [Erysipelotrichaceae bacterium]
MNDTNILVFGDSIVYGLYDNSMQGWVNRLKNYYDNHYRHIHVYNLGIPAETTEDLLLRIDNEIRCRIATDTIILIAIGINDSQLIDDKERITIDRFTMNIDRLIDIANKYSNAIAYISLTDVDDTRVKPAVFNRHKTYDNHRISIFNNIIRNECINKDITYIDLANLLNKEDLEDGIHPNDEGHNKIYNRVRNEIDSIFIKE